MCLFLRKPIFMKRLILFTAALCVFSHGVFCNELEINSGKIVSRLQMEGSMIRKAVFMDAATGREFSVSSGNMPLFQFGINGEVVSSDDPLWTYCGETADTLKNGGIQISYVFKGKKRIKGLELVWDRQYFPETAFLRERLRLKSAEGCNLRFTDIDGKNHFIFPQYSFNAPDTTVHATEIRIGTFGTEILPDYDPGRTYDKRSERNLATCHMFHKRILEHEIGDIETKGPFLCTDMDGYRILTTYEHASQDATFMKKDMRKDSIGTDAAQGVSGDMSPLTDDDLWFISTNASVENDMLVLGNRIRRGGYCDNEEIPHDRYYETVWSTISFLGPDESVQDSVHEYLTRRITVNGHSRKPKFYYNTWGMQRDKDLGMREAFTEKRIMDEIKAAGELGVEIFIFDDGWQERFGDWTANRQRLPNGLEPLIDSVVSYGMTPGVWISLLGVDPESAVGRNHPEWTVLDRSGKPVKAQWNYPAFDIVSGYYDILADQLKRLIDKGIRFFKWDAINTLSSSIADLGHGPSSASEKERIDRYNYLLPFYVTSLMRELREYCEDIVIEIDLTEPERALIGLMPLQEGKFFWMNNGASSYGDYSTFRTKSIRSGINEFHGLIPCELFTYAVYPYDKSPHYAQRYNINTILQCGHGIWGDLSKTSAKDRQYVGAQIGKAKKVLEYTAGYPLRVTGKIGSSPEIYVQTSPETGYALMTAFSGSAISHTEHITMCPDKILGALNSAYRVDDDGIVFDLQFPAADDSREAFVLGNHGSGTSIVSSSGWLDDISQTGNSLSITAGSQSAVRIKTGKAIKSCSVPYSVDQSGYISVLLQPGVRAVIEWQP